MPSRIAKPVKTKLQPLLTLLLVLWASTACALGAPAVPSPASTATPAISATPSPTPETSPTSETSPTPAVKGTPHMPTAAPPGSKMPPIPETLISPPPTQRLTMSEAIETGMLKNPQIAAARKTVEVAYYRLQQQYAGYYPSVDLSSSQTHSESQNSVFVAGQATSTSVISNNNSGGGSQSITTKRDPSNVQLSASQTLLDFGQRKLRVQQSMQNLEAVRQDFEKTKLDVTLTIRTNFFTAFVDQVLVDIKRQAVTQRLEHLRQAEGFYEAGVRAKNEVTKARSDLAQAQLELIRALGVLRTAWVNLNVSMGQPRDTTYELFLDRTDDVKSALDRERLLAVGLAQRPELLNLQAKILAEIYALEEVYAGRYPTISANAGYGWAGAPSPLNQAWSVGVRLDWNLFNGFLSHFQAKEARALAETLLLQLEQTRQQVYQEVENDYIVFETSRAAIDAARVSLENAQENFRLAQERYQVGLGSNLEFIDAQILLQQAQTDLATAQNAFRVSRAQLEHDLGVYSVDDLPPPAPPVKAAPIPGSKMPLPGVQ